MLCALCLMYKYRHTFSDFDMKVAVVQLTGAILIHQHTACHLIRVLLHSLNVLADSKEQQTKNK